MSDDEKIQKDRDNFAAYAADRVAHGWTPEHVAEYRQAVGQLMKTGSADDKLAACQFWQLKANERAYGSAAGINQRIRADNALAAADQESLAA